MEFCLNTSRNVLIGFIIILIGLSILFKTIGINIHLGIFIGPLIFFVLGLIFYRKNMRILSIIFFAIGLIALFDNVLHINIGGIIVALVFIYLGYRLLSGIADTGKGPAAVQMRKHRHRTGYGRSGGWRPIPSGIHH